MNNACPSCGAVYNIGPQHVGHSLACKKCGASLIVGPSGFQVPGSPTGSFGNQPPPAAAVPYQPSRPPVPDKREQPPASVSGGNAFLRFALFEKMISLWLLIGLYWLSVLFFVGWGLIAIIGSFVEMAESGDRGLQKQQASWVALGGVCFGFAIMLIGPLISRVYFEAIIVIFRMNESLTEIRDNTRK